MSVVVVLAGMVAGGQMGLFAGSRPDGLGVHEGRLKPAPLTPNCVNSQSAEGYSVIAPIAYTGDGKAAMKRLNALISRMTTARVIEFKPNYLYAEFSSKWLGFVDDVEFYLDEADGHIQVRSASRLGGKDFGVNRKRVESIRATFGRAL
ncbi:MAG: DUF1499 domain-containing protein [Sulfuritalea sp.]|nr:DUF1499 domain-containing protein [Sulfuritalea sp.]